MSGHHRLILRLAAMIVPGTRRADWLAEWEGELCHSSAEPGVDRARLTAFCWGAFLDALWLWRHHGFLTGAATWTSGIKVGNGWGGGMLEVFAT